MGKALELSSAVLRNRGKGLATRDYVVLGSRPTFLSRPLALQTVSSSTRHSLSHILVLSLNIQIWNTSIWVPSVASYRLIGVVRLTVSSRLHGSKSVHHRCSISPPPPHRLEVTDAIMRQSILLPTLACLILIVGRRVRGFSSGAPEESCDSLTVNHTHVGNPAPGAVCGPPCLTTVLCFETCLTFRQLRLIGSSADNFTYNCNETYERELSYICVNCHWSDQVNSALALILVALHERSNAGCLGQRQTMQS